MKRSSIYIWNIIGIFFTVTAGSLLHFINQWFPNPFCSIIGAVNESTWEHLKLIFMPMLAFGILEYLFYGKHIYGFFSIKVCSILLGMITIVTLFYTYTGVLGFHVLALDLAVFVLSILFAYWFACRKLTQHLPATGEFSFAYRKPDGFFYHPAGIILSAVILVLLLFAFVIFTFQAPDIGLFIAPVSE